MSVHTINARVTRWNAKVGVLAMHFTVYTDVLIGHPSRRGNIHAAFLRSPVTV
eukprot:m.78125 g.78125  ORF g.78125 m.78125 type:complete len:53 (+) comp16220_c0_seq4:140-298(+)